MTLHVVMTTSSAVYSVPGGATAQCITAITTAKDDEAHQVTETVYYKQRGSTTWEAFTQTFQFHHEAGHYDRMNNTELSEQDGILWCAQLEVGWGEKKVLGVSVKHFSWFRLRKVIRERRQRHTNKTRQISP
uniref:Lipocalin n=1 Tax=Rhipicephalus zambeziensis TaxID=60191 RepID=A0A224YLP6_9ACAR